MTTPTDKAEQNRKRTISVSKQVTIQKVADLTYSEFVKLDSVCDLPPHEQDVVWGELLEGCKGSWGFFMELPEEDDGGEDEVEVEEFEEDIDDKVSEYVTEAQLESQRQAREEQERLEKEQIAKWRAEEREKNRAEYERLKARLAELEKEVV